ncbi:hypothetical protein VC83_07031 [Pseudogymnoascus destructans]|uniref:LCCL domain-containing protein n=2 Tax=Pseudogymnoascus destructans TaxID=655981 RepID=L8G5V5_PSED2|nr:uncharacterized protein VC83_07031 [Pseudogymnoascus destructans]ELR07356.1 hypothetical protein GMDG_08371 [Pseudogymnoascus destructans 20631-21]OAF56869.1 hypothetical protein VC83_07031 [Pseudogymnoascus destructans]
MAAPAEYTIANLNGQWVLNKALSDETEPVLSLQGVGWLMRKAIGLATITLSISEKVENGVTVIDIESTGTGGIQGTAEHRVLDWIEHAHEDHVFGSLTSQTKWLDNKGADWDALDSFQKEGWLDERVGPNGEPHVVTTAVNKSNGWTATQVWGFTELNGVRYYTRKVVITKGSEVLKIRIFYDFVGPKA